MSSVASTHATLQSQPLRLQPNLWNWNGAIDDRPKQTPMEISRAHNGWVHHLHQKPTAKNYLLQSGISWAVSSMNKIKDMNDPRRQQIKPMTRGIKKSSEPSTVFHYAHLYMTQLGWLLTMKKSSQKKKTRLQLPRVAWLAIRETGSLEAIQGLGGWWKYPVIREAWCLYCCTLLLMAGILHQLIGSLSHDLQGFIHVRWCRISAINSMLRKTHVYIIYSV